MACLAAHVVLFSLMAVQCYWPPMQQQRYRCLHYCMTACLQVCICMNGFQTNYATYDYSIYTQLACLWTWLILIMIYDPISHYHYKPMYMVATIN